MARAGDEEFQMGNLPVTFNWRIETTALTIMVVQPGFFGILVVLLVCSGYNPSNAIRTAQLSEEQLAWIAKSGGVNFQNRVIDGEDVALGEAKYQISLQGMYGGHLCGGCIIDERHVLTAAHCVSGYNPSYLRVATGTVRWAEPDALYFVEEYWINCNYNSPAYHNDIALIRLNDTIKFNEYTQPAKLPTAPLANGTQLLLTGWGSTELWGDTPDVLQKAYLTHVDYPTCQALLNNDPMNGPCHVCTLTTGGQGSCHGDSGGPLTYEGVLYGLVNWGYPCALGSPDSHANVYYYLDWIRQTMSGPCSTCSCYASNYPSL
ncbi:chymotrypsin-2 [Drosophila biarmipes]|uniref:chymotrypsin-2 n=1 Tax=Drosophila biarmipes TaxID=125945 RepID=UPI001CDA5B96|nr:chymotrypsin-2 [Drosophila biarmipes]